MKMDFYLIFPDTSAVFSAQRLQMFPKSNQRNIRQIQNVLRDLDSYYTTSI